MTPPARTCLRRLMAALAVCSLLLPLLAASATADTPADTQTAAPGKVTDLVVTSTSDSVTVSWSAPADGGSVDRYKVNLKAVDSRRGKTRNPDASKTTVTFKKLLAGTEYRVWVRAFNDAGKSARVNARVTTQDADPAYVGGGAVTTTTTTPVCQPRVDVYSLPPSQNSAFYLLPEGSGPWPTKNNDGNGNAAEGAYFFTPEETCYAFGDRTAYIGGRYKFTRTLNVKVGNVRVPHEPGWYAWLPGQGRGGGPFVKLEVTTL